ncbi:MAG: PD-(D/E)XK nuclease family transposase [Eubacteriales bacterium]|nr:PD-(D/E)XK nuclease family transposase [Eubacteriales bacterium]
MQKKNLKIVDVIVQQDHKNLQGRSAVLDCVALDGEGNRFNVEVQQGSGGASPKRARYHSGLLDMNTLKPGEAFACLPESYVIFITRDDVLGEHLPIYHVDRMIREVNREFADQSHIIYVNASMQDDSELGRLMQDFHCKTADEMHSSVLADRVRELKESQKGVENMCDVMKKLYEEGVEEGIEKGMEQGQTEAILELLSELGPVPQELADKIRSGKNREVLRRWLKAAAKAESLEAFERQL